MSALRFLFNLFGLVQLALLAGFLMGVGIILPLAAVGALSLNGATLLTFLVLALVACGAILLYARESSLVPRDEDAPLEELLSQR